jgi:hypothetical protein
MKATSVTWRRTFPDSAPGTDGVAIFEGHVIGRVRHLTDLPRDPKPWMWSVTDPDLAGQRCDQRAVRRRTKNPPGGEIHKARAASTG